MIFVTVGFHSQGFERLIKKMDEIAGKIDEKVIMQIGSTSYKPINARYFDYIDNFQKIQALNKTARIVVCHGGAGVIITAFEQGTPVIAVPRLKKYNEHFNDHQLELVDALYIDEKIIAVYDIDKLEDTLNCSFIGYLKKEKEENRLVKALKEYIDELSH